MSRIKVLKYQVNFSQMTRKLHHTKRRIYDLAAISIRLEELQNKAARMVKINKPNALGTKITFEVLETAEAYQEAYDEIIRDGEALGLKFEKVAV